MRLQLKRMIGVLMLAAMAAMLVAAMGTSTAGASEFKVKSGEAFPVSFLGEGGLATFLSEKLNSVDCHNSHSKGEVKNSTLAVATILYLTNCLLVVENSSAGKFVEKCPDITTHELDIRPLSKLNLVNGLTGVLVLALNGTQTIATFTCSGANKVKVEVTGSVICESTPIGSLVLTGKIICKANASKHGEQEITSGENTQTGQTMIKPGLVAKSTLFEIFTETEKDSQTTEETVTYAKEVEQTA